MTRRYWTANEGHSCYVIKLQMLSWYPREPAFFVSCFRAVIEWTVTVVVGERL